MRSYRGFLLGGLRDFGIPFCSSDGCPVILTRFGALPSGWVSGMMVVDTKPPAKLRDLLI